MDISSLIFLLVNILVNIFCAMLSNIVLTYLFFMVLVASFTKLFEDFVVGYGFANHCFRSCIKGMF